MHEDDNIAMVKRGWQAIMEHDYDTLRGFLTDDTVWVEPLQPEHRGADAIIASLKKWDEMGFTQQGEAGNEGFFAQGDQVVSLEHVTATMHGHTIDTHMAHVYEIRNGKLARLTEYTSEPEKLAELVS